MSWGQAGTVGKGAAGLCDEEEVGDDSEEDEE